MPSTATQRILSMARKLRLALMSDLHNEMEPPPRPTAGWLAMNEVREGIPGHPEVGPVLDGLLGAGVNLVVLAGDIGLGIGAIEYAARASMFLRARAVCVMGNHEAYRGRDLDLLIPEMRAAAASTNGLVTFLEREAAAFDIGGQRLHVLGCTLWTDYEVNGSEPNDISRAMDCAGKALNDHRLIFLGGRQLTPMRARELHLSSRAWLAREVERIRVGDGDGARILIVTHHAPVPQGNAPQFTGGSLAPAFASDLTGEIAAWRPSAWFFGHTHHSLDMTVGGTRVVSAQRGYVCSEPGAEGFVPRVIEI